MGPVNCQEVSRSRNRTLGGQNRRFWLHNHAVRMDPAANRSAGYRAIQRAGRQDHT